MKCPEAVLRYCEDNWEDLEPLHAPAQIKSDSLELNNVWVVWYDEDQNFHCLDYTDEQLRVYCFTNAYPMAETTADYSDGDGCSIQQMDVCYEPVQS